MVPLRRALIVKEHGTLPYPEGTACADVLIAGEKGGNLAKMVFVGLGVAALYRIPMSILGLWKETPLWSASRTSAFPRATVASDVTPEYLGVGYIIGPRIAGVLVAGGVLSLPVLIPLIAIFGDSSPVVLKPGSKPIAEMGFNEIRLGYVRYIGAGAVAAAGLITLIRTLPTIVAAFRESFKSLQGPQGRRAGDPHRARHPDHLRAPRLADPGGDRRAAAAAARRGHRRRAPDGPPDGRLRLLLRHRLVAHRRHHRLVLEPDLRHDDRDPDGDLPASSSRWAGPATRTSRWRSASAPWCASPRPTPATPART